MKILLSVSLGFALLLGCSHKPEATNEIAPSNGAEARKPPEPKKATAPEPPKVFDQNGVEIEYRVRAPEHVLMRFGLVKELQSSDYVAWMMQAGGVFGRMVTDFDSSPDRHYVEVLLLFRNKAEANKRIDIANVFLEDGDAKILPWEALPSNAFENYAQLAQYIGLSEAPPTGSTVVTFNTEQDNKWRGEFYTSLKPSQSAWAHFVFLVPKTVRAAKLHFGSKDWNPIDVAI